MADTQQVARARINANGRIVIPKGMREALGAKPGDEVMLRMEDEGIVVYTLARAVKSIQAELRRHVPDGVSLVDELIADRRAEFARESAEPQSAGRPDRKAGRRHPAAKNAAHRS